MKGMKVLLIIAVSVGMLAIAGCGEGKDPVTSTSEERTSKPAAKRTVSGGPAGGGSYRPASRGILGGRAPEGGLTLTAGPVGGRPEFAVAFDLGAEDDGREIELGRGESLAITLASNPTTGYRWEVIEVEERVLPPVGESEFRPESDGIGAPGVEIFRFKAMDAGQTTLNLVYHRPWEEDVAPLNTFSLQVIVR